MAEWRSLVEQQATDGQQIINIIRNFRKDSADRKTSSYLENRRKDLVTRWIQFEARDKVLNEQRAEHGDHEYFAKDFFESVNAEFTKAIIAIEKLLMNQREVMTADPNPSTAKEDSRTNEDAKEPTVRLLRQQAFKVEAIKRILDSVSLQKDGKSKEFYEVKMNTLNQYWREIQQYQEQIAASAFDELWDMETYSEVEDLVQNALIWLRSKLHGLPQQDKLQSSKLKLPQIAVPTFDGDYMEWLQFYDLFLQMIHTQPLSNIEKMWFLKTNLRGEAERLIRHLPATGENYESAWSLLRDRYSNKRLTASRILDRLINQPSITTDSAAEVQRVYDTTRECCMALQNIQIETSSWDPIIIHIVVKKLSKETREIYEQSLSDPRALQSIDDCLRFLERRFQSLEAASNKVSGSKKTRTSKALTSSTVTSHPRGVCALCKGSHPVFACKRFLQLSPAERLTEVRDKSLCLNCLKSGHFAKSCSSRRCLKCNKQHNTLLHLEPSKSIQGDATPVTFTKSKGESIDIEKQPNKTPATLTASSSSRGKSYIILGTAIVKIITRDGEQIECRALLDSGSQVNLITERAAKRLNLKAQSDPLSIVGVGEGRKIAKKRLNITFQSRLENFESRAEVFVLPNIVTPQPTQYIDTSDWPIPQNIELADPRFHKPARIDLLLGAEFYHQLMKYELIRLGSKLPILQNTELGWIVTGKIDELETSSASCGVCSEDEDNLSNLIERFWKLEEVEDSQYSMTNGERQCEYQFLETVTRDQSNRFVVRLPFKTDPKHLGESAITAEHRFEAIERRLDRTPELKAQYVDFMKEYFRLGHMKEVHVNEIPPLHYYLPHHYVLKPDSSTTKLRVVFDASCKTSTGYSLNDVLHTGPTLQSDLFTILLRFRLPRYVFTADIEKMYRQIYVHPNEQAFQLIFWRNTKEDELKTYQLTTVTYGTRSAPYLAIKCLQTLAKEHDYRYPSGAQALTRNFYMDDAMAGADSLYDAKEMQKELIAILHGAGFKLRKWCSNHPQLLQSIPIEDQEIQVDLNKAGDTRINTLGLSWLPKVDKFCVKTRPSFKELINKRTVSSDIARLFDPLGILAPVVIKAKMFLQQLWKSKIGWDASLPEDLERQWYKFRDNLKALDNIQFSRHMFGAEKPKSIQIHGFADASKKAYGAVVYLRAKTENKRLLVNILCAKSKVAPLKIQNEHRYELCAALMACQLVTRVKNDLGLHEAKTFLWTDSQIALAWINSEPSSLKVFEANRVAKIQEQSRVEQWRYVRTKQNPADIVSRGLSPDKLAACNLWFYGPLFLHGDESLWPGPYMKSNPQAETASREEMSLPATHEVLDDSTNDDIIYKINHKNSFRKLQRIVAYMRRFINKTNPQASQQSQDCSRDFEISVQELNEAECMIVRQMQRSDFSEEIRQLRKHGEVSSTSKLCHLVPKLDNLGLLRVGGRLQSSNLSYEAKHPLLLAYDDPYSKLIMECLHRENSHCGATTLLAITRQRFWPLKGKSLARSIVQHCVKCSKAKPNMMKQIMGNLPASRVQPCRPFLNSGVDFCGPIWIHYQIRGKRPQKAYIAVFCCFATKAIHLEIVSNLTTEAFIGVLNRFIGRRGHCAHLYCDNATNFIGAKNQLEQLTESIHSAESRSKIISSCSAKNINFHFIPPRAPHFGGLWEAAVKSAKHLLLRSMSAASLTYEELETLAVGVEAILNSRPLTPMSDDPNDLRALTPGHFLIGEPLTAPVDQQATSPSMTLQTRWKLVNQLRSEFWTRWSSEYLNELQYRTKWTARQPNVDLNKLVVIREDNLPVAQWPLGRIVKVYPGEDNLIRVVDVQTQKGIFKRPIHRLSPLPVQLSDEQGITQDASPREELSDHATTRRTDDRQESPSKRRKIAKGSLLTTLLAVCLLLPLCTSSLVDVEKFEPNPGAYFEHLGTTEFVSTNWNLIVYFDLNLFWLELTALKNGTSTLDNLCQLLEQRSQCTQLSNQFKSIRTDIQRFSEMITTKRTKRGAFNFVGNIASSLFGVLDTDYAEEMSRTINNIKGNEEYMVKLLRNQTSIIDSTINIVKRDQRTFETKFKSLEGEVASIIYAINKTTSEQFEFKVIQNILSLSVQLVLVTANLHRMQDTIIEAITDTHHGKISATILSPNQLHAELATLRSHLPSHVHLPVETDHPIELYRLMSVQVGLAANNIIFRITIPLVNDVYFNLFEVIPIPTVIEDEFVGITPCAQYMAINLHIDEYMPLEIQDLAGCHTLQDGKHICELKRPIYRKEADICSCEINLLSNASHKNCDLRKRNPELTWAQLQNSNHWIYSVLKPTPINAICGQQITQLSLQGSGILKMDPKCMIKFKTGSIQGHLRITTNRTASYSTLGVLQMAQLPELVYISKSNSSPYNGSLRELEKLQEWLLNESYPHFSSTYQPHLIHQLSISYIALSIAIFILGYAISIKIVRKCKQKPIPAPRQRRPANFTVEI